MAYFVRTIQDSRWFKYPEVSWLLAGEAPGDAVVDLRVRGGALSIYQADDKEAMLRTVAALAATRDHLAKLDYSWFDGGVLPSYGILVSKVPGCTPDAVVDDRHYDVVELSAVRAGELANIIARGDIDRLQKSEVRNLLRERIRLGHLDKSKVNLGVLKAL